MEFLIAKDTDIKKGLTTDVYFDRTVSILRQNSIKRHVIAEFTVSSLPDNYNYAVFSGLFEVLYLLEGKNVNLYSLPEGTIFHSTDSKGIPIPVMYIEGLYDDFAIFETPVLGIICQSSGIATKAARVKDAAGNTVVLSFGIRRMHPALAPLIDRNAYIGGCDGVSSLIGARTIGKKPSGTMPHALMITMGEDNAWKAYDKALPPDVPKIALIDTYGDEKVKAIRAAKLIKNLTAVRLDTPSSRRGDFPRIVREVRWELDIRGYRHIGIIVSGGLDEQNIKELKEAGATGFGVGTSISNARTIDYAMDIVEMEGKPVAKKGKFGGKKQVYRCGKCGRYTVAPAKSDNIPDCPVCGIPQEPMLKPVLINGEITGKSADEPDKIRKYVLEQLKNYQ